MRDDEEVKAELHQRVEDLNEKLWAICDNKKLESERERENIMNNGWLSDKIGLLTNHYITLMQVYSFKIVLDFFLILNANFSNNTFNFGKKISKNFILRN